jgi:hypothetical protein
MKKVLKLRKSLLTSKNQLQTIEEITSISKKKKKTNELSDDL